MFPAMGQCDPARLGKISAGRRVRLRKYRGSVWRWECNKGFTLLGPSLVFCDGAGTWSQDTTPLCVSKLDNYV